MQETRVQSLGQEDLLERAWQPTPVFAPGECHGQRGYGSRGHKKVRHNLATKQKGQQWGFRLSSTLKVTASGWRWRVQLWEAWRRTAVSAGAGLPHPSHTPAQVLHNLDQREKRGAAHESLRRGFSPLEWLRHAPYPWLCARGNDNTAEKQNLAYESVCTVKKKKPNTWSWKTSCNFTILGCPSQSLRAVTSFWVLASILKDEAVSVYTPLHQAFGSTAPALILFSLTAYSECECQSIRRRLS